MDCFPDRRADAATNMAMDQLMLIDYPSVEMPRFRHYDWEYSAFTFGFAQTWEEELDTLVRDGHEVIRRETGGGLVDHRNDWTYGLVIPLSHQRGKEAPTEIYRDVHVCMIEALQKQNADAILQQEVPPPKIENEFSACFNRAELNDVITQSKDKVAGAAQRRNREGFLIQGYISRSTLPNLDWQCFKNDFIERLTDWLDSSAREVSWPKWDEVALNKMKARFASEAWNKKRKRE
ncbi:lipoate--protein ligase family protein [Rubellicoccus peritrichatus]|uniref:BPL/LPL catalytic domain-containing protein n=1 Tax=Rubellicoccus peritrichatus TaxID=3080537 RepID=A0AAQ3LA63_9BACT|nr:hypothetical protein [Puniceicoccus sp. CR14]WOO40779.1 hypothetical protein RZN69_19320 [Puniceicoccus sp. CR14]